MQTYPNELSSTIIFPTPKPMIIYTGKSVKEWEEMFKAMMDESNNIAEKHDYDQCYSTLRWAHFCDATSLSLRVGKHLDNYTVEIKFFFADYNHLKLFFNELYKVLEGTMRY